MENNDYNVNEVYETSKSNNNNYNNNYNENINYDQTASPSKIDQIITQPITSMQALENSFIENNINNSNYPTPTETFQYEQPARIETPPKKNSIKNNNENEFEGFSYEPNSYVEQQTGNP